MEEFGLENQIDLRYCKLQEINQKKARTIVISGQFYMKMNHLKSLGQKLIAMKKIEEFIIENIDFFWNNESIRSRFLDNQKQSKDINSLLANKNDLYRKQKLVEALLDYAEDLQIKRRQKIRFKRVDNLRERANIKIDFRTKNKFIQNQIENDINFFNCRYNKNVEMDLDEIRKILTENNKILE